MCVCVCALFDFLVLVVVEATREAVFVVVRLWTGSTQNVAGSRPGCKLSCLIFFEVYKNFAWGEGQGMKWDNRL